MSIPASYIVDVTPRVVSAGGKGLELNGLLLTKNPELPVNTVKSFTGSDLVGKYFGIDSKEYEASLVYFAGYSNSFKKPTSLKFYRRVDKAVNGYLRGGVLTTSLEDLQKISNGSMKISVDNILVTLDNINLSKATSYSAIAKVLQDKISLTQKVQVTYSSLNKSFQIDSKIEGVASSVSFASSLGTGTDLSEILCLTIEKSPTVSNGSEVLTASDQLNTLVSIDSNWATVATIYYSDSNEAVAINDWCTLQGVSYLYIAWSNEASALLPDNNTDLVSKMIDKGATNFVGVYGDYRLSTALMGVVASIDYTRTNGAIDVAFKHISGVDITCNDKLEATILDNKLYNYYGNFATRNDEFSFIYKGVIVGAYKFISAYVNAIWLNNSIQLAFMSGLKVSSKLPYNTGGYTQIRSWATDPINQGISNGVIQVGVSLTDSQKNQLLVEAGTDISQSLFSNGYYLQILDPGAGVRATGDSPVINLWYTDGGGIKKLSMSSTLVQ